MANIYRLIFSLFIVFYSSASFALVPTSYFFKATPYDQCSGFTSAVDAAMCSALAQNPGKSFSRCEGSADGGNFKCYYAGTDRFAWSGVNKYSSCPSNSSPSGTQCVCNAGYEEKNGQCEAPDECDGLEQICFNLKGQKASFAIYQSPGDLVCMQQKPSCSKGCGLDVGFTVGYASSIDDNKFVYDGSGTYLGSVCTGQGGDDDLAKEPDKKCAPGETEGFFNQTRVCIPPKSKESNLEYKNTDNGDGTKTETISTVKCENGICTIKTEVTIKDQNGNSLGNKATSETKITEAEFCQKNPASLVCRTSWPPGTGTGTGDGTGTGGTGTGGTGTGGTGTGGTGTGGTGTGGTGTGGTGTGDGEGEGAKSSFSGSCSSGFSCEGDAITCAIAKSQHEQACNIQSLENTSEYALWNQYKNWDGQTSVTGALPGNRQETISIKTNDEFIGGGSCPPDEVISLPFGVSLTLTFSGLCYWLVILGDGLVIFAYIMGAYIVIRRQI